MVAQWLMNPTTIHEVQSLASLSELRIQCYRELWCTSKIRLRLALMCLWYRPAVVADSTPSLGISICLRCSPKKKKRKEKKKGQKKKVNSQNSLVVEWFRMWHCHSYDLGSICMLPPPQFPNQTKSFGV